MLVIIEYLQIFFICVFRHTVSVAMATLMLLCSVNVAFGQDPFAGIVQDAQPFLDFMQGPFAYLSMFVAIIAVCVLWMFQRFTWTLAAIILFAGVIIGQAGTIAAAITGYSG